MTAQTATALSDRFVEELELAQQRATRGFDLLRDQSDAPVGLTPRELVGRFGKAKLYRYRARGERYDTVPMLFVPYVGISRPYVYDLPGSSFFEFLIDQGVDLYFIEWGDLGPEDADFTFESAVMDVIPAMLRRTLRHSKAAQADMLGYCMGVPLSLSFLGTHPEAPVRNLVTMVGPVDFAEGGFFRQWQAAESFPLDKLVDTYKAAPLEYVRLGFKLLSPTGDAATALSLWRNLDKEAYVQNWRAMNRWSNDWVGMPAEFFRQWVRWFYQENRLAEGTLVLRGRRVDLKNVRQPLLAIAGRKDTIVPPAAARALVDLVGSADTTYEELPGGHISVIAGRQANQQLWPKLIAWLREHSSAAEGEVVLAAAD